MTQLLQATLYGLLQGGLLALVAVGFSLVWGVMNVVNLSHGVLVLAGAYIALQLHEALNLDPFISMMPAALVLFVVGYLLQRFFVNLVINGPLFITLLLTFGFELVGINLLQDIFTPDYQSITTSYAQDSFVLPADIRLPYGRVIGALLAIAFTVALVYVMKRTRTGLSILATGMDRGAARLMGINARHVYALTFAVAAAMAGAAGAALGAVTTFSPADAGRYTLFSFVVAVVGGLGNMWGALYGGLILGVVQGVGSYLLPGQMVNAVVFAALVLLLAIRPEGIAGKAFYASRQEV